MGIRVHRTVAQAVVGLGVLVLLAGGVWLAVSSSGEVAECFRTAPCSRMPTCPVEVVSDTPPARPFPLSALVPATAEFVVSTTWAELRSSPWVESGILGDDVLPSPLQRLLDERQRVDELDLPAETAHEFLGPEYDALSLEDELFPDEVVLTGWFPRRGDRAPRAKAHGGFLLLTRITPRLEEALSKLSLEEAAARLPTGLELSVLEDGILSLHSLKESSHAFRMRLPGAASVLTPVNPWLLFRANDVVAIGGENSRIREVAELARFLAKNPGQAALLEEIPPTPRVGMSARAPILPLRPFLKLVLYDFDIVRLLSQIRDWIWRSAPEMATLVVDAGDHARMRASGTLTHEPGRLLPRIRAAHDADPVALEAVASLVPSKDTFALLSLRYPAELVLKSLYRRAFNPGDRKLLRENFRRTGEVEELELQWQLLVESLDDASAIAVARRGDINDGLDHEGFFDADSRFAPGDPAWALISELSESANVTAVAKSIETLSSALYGDRTIAVPYRGRTLRVAELDPGMVVGISWAPTAWLLTDEVLIVSNAPQYLERFVDISLDRSGSLAEDATWRETFATLPAEAHIGAFVDLGKLFRVPTTTRPGSQPRGLLWDRRQAWVSDHYNPREEAKRYRLELLEEAGESLEKTIPPDVREHIEELVDLHHDEWLQRYPEFEERYRQELLRHTRLRGLGFTIVVDGATMHLRGVLGAEGETK